MLIFIQNIKPKLGDFGDPLSLLGPLAEKNGLTWVDPSLQVEVTYFEETESGHFRFPVFKRIVE